MKTLRFLLVALLTSLLAGGMGVVTFDWMTGNQDNDILSYLVTILSVLLASVLVSYVLGIILKPFDVNKKYRFWVPLLITVCIFLVISYPAIAVYFFLTSRSASSVHEGMMSFMVFTCLCPLATHSALMVGLPTVYFSWLGSKLRNKTS